LGDRVVVGTEQFIYYDAADPKRCLAPDVMVWVGGPDEIFGSWKVWERGAPHVAVEIVSPSDSPPGPWQEKLHRYRSCGIGEIVRFDPVARSSQLRIWDRVEGDLVERDLTSPEGMRCDALGLYWCLTRDESFGLMLRLARDEQGLQLLPTPREARKLEAEARKLEAEARKLEAETAAARIRVLEDELRKRG
jgi:Uma2 family endonuclease